MRFCSTPKALRNQWLHRYRRAFQAATFDFVELMDIDWRAAFTCLCNFKHWTADGIAIGHKLMHSYLQRAYELTAGAAAKAGVVLADRLVVRDAQHRRWLLQLTDCGKDGGLLPDGLAQLLQAFQALRDEAADAAEASLLPFLSETVAAAAAGDKLLAPAKWRQLLQVLGTTAPAIQLLPFVLWDAAEQLLTQRQLSCDAETAVHRFSPVLHRFLQPYLAAAECDAAVLSFMRALLKVHVDNRLCQLC